MCGEVNAELFLYLSDKKSSSPDTYPESVAAFSPDESHNTHQISAAIPVSCACEVD